jgi:hypothetical protein
VDRKVSLFRKKEIRIDLDQAAGNIQESNNVVVKRKSTIFQMMCLLSFFPFFSFVPGLHAEIQPYCYLVGFIFVIIFRQKLPIELWLFICITLIYFSIFIIKGLIGVSGLPLESVPHLLIFLGPPIFFWILLRHLKKLNMRLVHNSFYIWVAVGFLQYLFPSFFSALGLKRMLELLIPRFSSQSLAEFGDRGVTSLSNEPSYAGIVLFSLFIAVIYRRIQGSISKNNFRINIVLFVASVVFNASITIFILTVLLLLAYVYHTRKYVLSLFIFAMVIIPFAFVSIEFRIFDLITLMPQLLEASDWNPYYLMIGPLGSHRELSAFVGIKSGFYNPWGNGYYSSMTDFINVAKAMKVDLTRAFYFDYHTNGYYVNMKPYGYGALTLFELGMIPFLLVNHLLFKMIKQFKKNESKYKRFGSFLSIGILLLINFSTPASLPAYWFSLALCLFMMRDAGLNLMGKNEE